MLARFLSPDPYVQAPDYTQGFNRYSYCYNNPFKYTDPDGEWVHIVIGAVIGGVINWATHGCQFNMDGLVAFGIGAAGGALTAATGGAALGALGTAGIFSATGVLGTGFAAGVGYSYGTAVTSLGNSIYFGDPMPTTKQFLTGLAVTVGTVGLTQGVINGLSGNNILTGEIPRVKIPEIDPLPTPDVKPLQTEEIQTPQIKSPDDLNLNKTSSANNSNNTLSRLNSDGIRFEKAPVSPRTITGMTEELPIRAAERGFAPEDIIKIVDKGNMTEAMGRYGPQIRYTLGNNTVVVDRFGTIITCFSNAPATSALPRGYFIPF